MPRLAVAAVTLSSVARALRSEPRAGEEVSDPFILHYDLPAPGGATLPLGFVKLGPGYCAGGYYAGWDGEADSVEMCANKCRSEPSCKFFAIKVGFTCSRYNVHAGRCDYRYNVNDHVTYAKHMFPVTFTNSSSLRGRSPYHWVGCFADDAMRDLNDQKGEVKSHTAESCWAACENYNYMALQNGGTCRCGDGYATKIEYRRVDDSECTTPCELEASSPGPHKSCGGFSRNAIYRRLAEVPKSVEPADPELPIKSKAFDHRLFMMMPRTGWSSFGREFHCAQSNVVRESYPKDLMTMKSAVARDFVGKVPEGESTLVVAFLRNPFAQMISWYFGRIAQSCCGEKEMAEALNRSNVTMEQLHEDFSRHLPVFWTSRYAGWVGGDLSNITNISIASRLFDPEKHSLFAQHAEKKVAVLLLRVEDMMDWHWFASEHLPELRPSSFQRSNNSNEKWYTDIYKRFVSTYRFGERDCARVRQSDSWRYYSEVERQRFLVAAGCRANPSSTAALAGDGRLSAVRDQELTWVDMRQTEWTGDRPGAFHALQMHDLAAGGWDGDFEPDGDYAAPRRD